MDVVGVDVSTRGPSLSTETDDVGRDWSVLDVCCGLGGISLAARGLGCHILAGIDLSRNALDTFSHNFPAATAIECSITTKVAVEKAKAAFDLRPTRKSLIVSGPPCQGFSPAGRREKRDPRNRVLAAVVRSIANLQPDAAIIENVAALLAKRHRGHFSRFIRILNNAGYSVETFQLDASRFGVPQRRHRMICFAAKGALTRSTLEEQLRACERPAATVRQALAGLDVPPVYPGPNVPFEPPVPNHIAMRHCDRVKEKIAAIAPGTGPMSYRRLHPDQVSRTLISGNRAPPAHFSEARSITVREAARLQGFPDDFTVKGSFANQMLHVTNAVPPMFAKAALIALFRTLEAGNA